MHQFSDTQRQFLDSKMVGRLASVGQQQPHCVPVCYAFADHEIWIAIDEKPKSGRRLRRLRNIEENPRVALTIDHYEDDWSQLAYLIVEGSAELRELTLAASEALLARYPQYHTMKLEQGIAITVSRTIFWSYHP